MPYFTFVDNFKMVGFYLLVRLETRPPCYYLCIRSTALIFGQRKYFVLYEHRQTYTFLRQTLASFERFEMVNVCLFMQYPYCTTLCLFEHRQTPAICKQIHYSFKSTIRKDIEFSNIPATSGKDRTCQ